MRWRNITALSGVLILFAGGVAFGPLLLNQLHDKPETKAPATLQSLIESGEIRHLDSTHSIESLLPYNSISMERTPCFGPCPVYVVTFYRNGQASLVTDHLLQDKKRQYIGKIWPQDYARLTQLVSVAKRAAQKEEYAGQWTDDSSSIITATGNGTTWKVLDYGRVAPPEIWALEHIIEMYREKTEWSPAGG